MQPRSQNARIAALLLQAQQHAAVVLLVQQQPALRPRHPPLPVSVGDPATSEKTATSTGSAGGAGNGVMTARLADAYGAFFALKKNQIVFPVLCARPYN